jgi:O-Antigen ligase
MLTTTQTVQSYAIQKATAAPASTHKAQIYGALAVMITVPVLCMAGGQAGVLRIAFPVLSLVICGFLFWRSKPHYVGLVFWLWFVTPFLSRMADFQGGWETESAVLLAPYLGAGISVITLLTSLRELGNRRSFPYICALAAILYGSTIGLDRYSLFNALRAILNWCVPVFFGFFIYQHSELYYQFRKAIEQAFLYCLLVTGAYGVYQFWTLPDWDKMWLLNVQLNSFGAVEAMEIRAFSTMNAPAIFAAVMASGLLLLFCMKGKLRLVSAACGFLGLMLTMSRASWISLIAGFAFLATRLDMRQRLRLAVAAVACVVFLFTAFQIPVIHSEVTSRIETFSDPSQDVSFSARVRGHEAAFQTISREPFGEGIGSTDAIHNTEGDDDIIGPHDSTLLEFLYSLGWVGTLIYGAGLGALSVQLMKSGGSDSFVLASKAIIVGFVAQCLLNSVLIGILGFLVWTFASMCLAQSALAEKSAKQPEIHEYATT